MSCRNLLDFLGRAGGNPLFVEELTHSLVENGSIQKRDHKFVLTRNPSEKMTFLVNSVQERIDLPLFLDTTNSAAMEAGLAACSRRAVINGVSLEPEKLAHILPLAKVHDADLVCYLLRPDGQVPNDRGRCASPAVLRLSRIRSNLLP